MTRVRQPNEGPYELKYRPRFRPEVYNWKSEECHTWKFACERMRQLLIEGNEVKISFV